MISVRASPCAGTSWARVHTSADIPSGNVSHSDVVRQFERLVERIPGIVAYMDVVQPHDPGCSIPVYISPQVEDLLGYPREQWLTDDELWLDVLHPEDAERMIAADEHARATLSSLFAEYRMVARDGGVVWVSEKAAVVKDEGTDTLYWQGVMVDITDRKHAEEALADSERQFRSIFDAAAIGVMTIELDGRIVEANHMLEQVCGYPAGALHGRALADCLDPADGASLERFAQLGAGVLDRSELEHRFRRSDGSSMWCRTVMTLVRDGAGRPAHITAMLEDIGDRRRLVDAERRESLVTVAAGVAHGFNNLLQVILGGVGLIKEHLPPDQELEAIVRGIDTATTKAVEIAGLMRAYSGDAGPQRREVDLAETIQKLSPLLEILGSSGVRVTTELAPAVIVGDESAFEQVVLNLVTNAVEAVGDGGTIHITTGSDANSVLVSVHDDGVGMTEETIARVFDPYFSTRFTGRGLGLAAADGIVRGHGGRIDIRSRLGVGTTMTVTLPRPRMSSQAR
jgi:two-component system cell cycle sensor histidine kinase/response regulator CckA